MKPKTTKKKDEVSIFDDACMGMGKCMMFVKSVESDWKNKQVILQFDDRFFMPIFTFAMDNLIAMRWESGEFSNKKFQNGKSK